TCWNSEQGTPQHVLVEFSTPVCISEIRIQFQGGFAGAETRLVDATRAVDICPLHPDDSNKLQSFALPATEQPVSRRRIKILFATSTDFYGRIIVYALDFVGHLAHPDASPANPARSAIATTDPTTSSDNAAVASSDTIVII
ncbi:Nuclear receptor 2C2-associated protein, partial [Coemansia sp. RSA 1933]